MTELLDDDQERQLVRVLQVGLLVIAAYGFYRGETGIVANGLVPLVVTLVPAYLRRDRNISMDTSYVLWIAIAVFVHAVGSLGLYESIPWYDSIAHALSATIVAGTGYAAVKAIDRNSEQTNLPAELQFAFILVFVMAFGVFWEIIEFTLGLASQLLGGEAVLAQYGLDDTVTDLLFNQLGAIIVAGPQEAADTATAAMDD